MRKKSQKAEQKLEGSSWKKELVTYGGVPQNWLIKSQSDQEKRKNFLQKEFNKLKNNF
jgi:hypothetical protein